MTTPVIEANNLSKYFNTTGWLRNQVRRTKGKKSVLNGISFHLKAGDTLGLVGPNGAGKTTLIRIMADLLEPDAGTVKIMGQTVLGNGNHLRKHIGYVSSDERNCFWRLSGKANLEFFGKLYGLSNQQLKKRISELLSLFSFEKHSDQLFRDYSTGMRKKISIMRALLHKPAILLLDEVTNSLDQNSITIIKSVVHEYVSQRKNRVAIWSTHRQEEVHEICNRILSIESGKVSFLGPVDEFQPETNVKPLYMLRLANINGGFKVLSELCCEFGKIKSATHGGDESEIVFDEMSEEAFGEVVNLAVKDFGAYVIFAGRIDKHLEKVN